MAKKKNSLKIQDIARLIEERTPTSAAESWDNVGLIAGFPQAKFTGAVVGVDLTRRLLNAAISKKSNLIITHHPALFPKGRGLSKLIAGNDEGTSALLLEAYTNGISVYVTHTNFDQCALDGMLNLANDLGAIAEGRLFGELDDGETFLKKLVTYVPKEHFDRVRDALYEGGCGHIGNYDSCGFAVLGAGSYRGLAGSTPSFGEPGKLEHVEEIRLETIFPTGLEPLVLRVLKGAHPYEEVAYDIFPVEQKPSGHGMVYGLGYGFIGSFPKAILFNDFVKRVKSRFLIENFLVNSACPKKIQRIAFSPGKGSSFVSAALCHDVDVFITGEVGYHDSLRAAREGLCVFELGHRESERYFLITIDSWLKEWNLKVTTLDERTQAVI